MNKVELNRLQQAYTDGKEGRAYTLAEEVAWSKAMIRAEFGKAAVEEYEREWKRVEPEALVERLMGEVEAAKEREYEVWRQTRLWAEARKMQGVR